ncbi:MAG: hypothetical protein L3J70_08025 [Gammaproteobacteria bacterium]|nr:hypothetical protein [Gammaproteobacteria bacterium]
MKTVSTHQLRSLIGTHINWQDQEHVIIEVLEDEAALVLKSTQQPGIIQPDQHGEAHRRVPSTITLPVYTNAEKTELSSEFIELKLNY